MSRILLLATALATLTALAIPAMAQGANPDVTVDVANVPTAVTANGTTVAVPMRVAIQVSNLACLPGPGTLTVSVAASAGGNATGNTTMPNSGITIERVPDLTFTMPPAALTFSQTQDITLVMHSSSKVTGPVTVMPTVVSLSGCTGASASGAGAPHTMSVTFQSSGGTGTAATSDEATTPGIELPLLALAILGAVVILRRKA